MFLGLLDNSNNITAATIILSKNINNKFKYGIAPFGYLLDFNNKELLEIFSRELKLYLKKFNFLYVRVNPRTEYKVYDKKKKLISDNEKLIENLKICGYNGVSFSNPFDRYSVRLMTPESLATVYSGFSRSIKRNINYCLQMGITVVKSKEDNLELFFELVKDKTNKSLDYYRNLDSCYDSKDSSFEVYFAMLNPETYITNYQYFLKKEQERNAKLSTALKNNFNNTNTNKILNKKMTSDKLIEKYKNEMIRATNVYKIFPKGIAIGTCAIIRSGNEVDFIIDGFDRRFNYVYTIPFIRWEIIKKFSNQGYKLFDFGTAGKDILAKNDEYASLFNSKTGMGGKLIEYVGEFDLVINKSLYTIYSSFSGIKKSSK